jgi:uncharacterized protein (DUF305 family)
MTTNKLNHKQPLIYGLGGVIVGAVVVSLAGNSFRIEPQLSLSSTIPEVKTAAPPVKVSQTAPSTPNAIPAIPGMMVQSDQHFIVMMIPHHRDAVEMAELALKRAQHPEIKKLAEAIKTTQTQEIQQMKAWYKQWYGTDAPSWTPRLGMIHRRGITPASPVPGMRGKGYMGMGAMGTDLDALKKAADFDQEFIVQMIPHHQMAIMMSGMVANSATHREIRDLAQSISQSQSAEIEQMQTWYKTWY